MTRREQEALPTLLGLCLGALVAVIVIACLGMAQERDRRDDERLRERVAKKVDRYADLDHKARQMVAYDRIKREAD